MKKSILIILFFPLAAFAQDVKTFEYPRFRLGIETGVGFLAGNTIKPDAIRENQSYYYDDYSYRDYYHCGFVIDYHSIPHYYFGVKPEFSLNNGISFSGGLRFLGSNSILNSDKDYFLWKVSENDLTTNYVRVKDVKQNNFYVGFPVEMTIYTYKREIRVRHYIKWGANFNFLLLSKTTPCFEDAAMNKYVDKITNDIEKTSRFTPAAFIGTGLKINRMNRPFGTVEFRMPFVLKGNTGFSSFVNSSVGFEVQTAIYFPVGKQKITCIYN